MDGVCVGVTQRLGRALLVGRTLTAGFLLLFALAGTLFSVGAYVLVTAMPWIGLCSSARRWCCWEAGCFWAIT